MAAPLLVLGLGNVLCGDDGAGVLAVAELERRYRIPDGVRVADGGTLGLALLSWIDRDQDLILVDAVAADRPVGSLVRLSGEEAGAAARERLSCHQIGVADLLDALRLTNRLPRRLLLLGVVPGRLELGLERSPEVLAALPRLVDAVAEEARRLGYDLRPRTDDDVESDRTARDAAVDAVLL